MPLDMIIGAQWGDEGKGTITDLMSAELDIVARYSGGDNAGHTVTVADEVFKRLPARRRWLGAQSGCVGTQSPWASSCVARLRH